MSLHLRSDAHDSVGDARRATAAMRAALPPVAARPQLPPAARRAEVDWAFTIIVALSFLVHFGFMGSMFSDWLDPVVDTDAPVVGVVDVTAPPRPASVEDSASNSESSSRADDTRREPNRPPVRSQVNVASLAREAEEMELNLLTAMGSSSPAVTMALNRDDVPYLGDIARDARGIATNDPRVGIDDGITPVTTDLRHLGATEGGTLRAGDARHVSGPKVDIVTAPQCGVNGMICDAWPTFEVELGRLRRMWRACYDRALSVNPAMEGKLTIDVRIAPNGEVTDVSRVESEGLPSAVEQCIIQRTKYASFDAQPTGATVRIPIFFRHQS